MTREELKRELMAQAEAAIDKMLADKPEDEHMRLGDIEDLAIQTGHKVEQGVLGSLLASSGRGQAAAEVLCVACGRKMQRKGRRKRRVISQAGEGQFERAYYYCQHCGTGVFPPG